MNLSDHTPEVAAVAPWVEKRDGRSYKQDEGQRAVGDV